MLISHIHEGEIIPPGDSIDCYYRPSPLREQRHRLVLPAGLSIREVIGDLQAAFGGAKGEARLYVEINGHAILPANYGRVRVKAGATVTVIRVPGNNTVRQIVSVVVAVAAIAVGQFYLAPAILGGLGIAAGTIAGNAITGLVVTGLTVAGSLAVNALFPVARSAVGPAQSASGFVSSAASGSPTEDTRTLFSIGGGQNAAQQYGVIPQIFGTHRISPDYAAGAYTEIIGDDEYLRLLFCVGYGPCAISDIRIAETPIEQFDGVQYEVITDHTQQSSTLYSRPTYQEQLQIVLDFASGWVTRTTADNVDEISIDVSFPNGVYRFQRADGNRVNHTVYIQAEYSISGANAWASLGTIAVESNSQQAIRRALYATVPRGQYDIRVGRPNPEYVGEDTVVDGAIWTALRARRYVQPISFAKPLTLIAVRIKASAELNGTVSQLNCIAAQYMRAWNGSAWVGGQITSSPADHFREILQGNANARPVPDSAIDLQALQDWKAFCTTNGFQYDLIASTQRSVYDRLTEVCAAGRAVPVFRDGKWSVVWDAPDGPIVQHFSPRNSWNFSSVRGYADLPHGLRISFINRDNNYLNDERVVYADGYSAANATKLEGLDFPGVTSPDMIWRHGRYHLAQLRLQRELYTLETDWEHLSCTRGDRVRVNYDTVLWGAGAGRVKSVSAGPDTVVLDELLTMEAGRTYALRFRLADGSSLVRTVTGVDGDFQEITLDGTGTLPAAGDLFLFGEQGFDSVVLRVKSITPTENLGAVLTLVDDAPAILEADTGPIPAFTTGILTPADYRRYQVASLLYTEEVWTTQPPTSQIRLTWQAPDVRGIQGYIVQYARRGTEDWSRPLNASGPQIDITDLAVGDYVVRVRPAFFNGQTGGWLNRNVTAGLFASMPADIQDLRVEIAGDVATLQWGELVDPTVRGVQIRYSPAVTGATWDTATVLRQVVTGRSAQVQAMRGTYFVKWVTWANLYSYNATLIVNTLDPRTGYNAVETVTEESPFLGVMTNVIEVDDKLRLQTASDFFDPDDFFDPPDFFLQSGYVINGTYEFADVIDLLDVYYSRVTVELDAYGELSTSNFFARSEFFVDADFFGDIGGLWNVKVQISTTLDDPAGSPTWSPWVDFIAGNITARAYRIRLILLTQRADVTPVVTSVTVTVDMPDRRVEAGDVVATTSGLTINFDPPMKVLKTVSVTAQDMQTGDYPVITGKSANGFSIIFRDSANAPVERTFDYVATGYGVTTPVENVRTLLRREDDGTVTVVALARPWTPTLVRNGDGTATIS